jgi:hypothetical protein
MKSLIFALIALATSSGESSEAIMGWWYESASLHIFVKKEKNFD